MSTPWIVHQYALSPNAERLRRVLVRLELPFEVEDYLPFDAEGRAKVAALVERAGHNQMPVLERDGAYFGDSLAITEMLLEEYPERAERLIPADPAQAAAVHAYMLAGDSGFLRPEGKFLTDDYRQRKGEAHVEKIINFAHQRGAWALSAWDRALAHQPFLAGEAYSLADIGVVPYITARIAIPQLIEQAVAAGMPTPFNPEQWPAWDLDAATYPHLRAWFDRCNTAEYTESRVAAA